MGRLVGDRYRVLELLGRGGMGSVYVAEQLSMKRTVALKVINALDNPDHAARRQAFKRFEREAHAASRLEHHNTVRVFDFGMSDDGTMFLAMELLRGRTLGSIMRDGPMPPGRVVKIAVQICRSLAEAHDKGIIHRDLKPDNIMVTDTADEKDFVKVLDFGIAKIAAGAEESSVTSAGMIVGTPAYMAPEQATASRVVPATDLYSLGVIMYEALTGRPPFDAPTPVAILMKHVNELPPPLVANGFPPGIPVELGALVMRLLEKSHHLRPKSAMELASLLAGVPLDGDMPAMAGQPAAFAAPSMTPSMADSLEFAMDTTVSEKHPAARRGRLIFASIATFVALLAGGAAAVLLGPWNRNVVTPPSAIPTPPVGSTAAEPTTGYTSPAGSTLPAAPATNIAADRGKTLAVEPEAPAATPVPASGGTPGDAVVVGKPARGAPHAAVKADKPRLPACVRANCPIAGDCADDGGRRLDGTAFCSDLAL